MPHEIIYSTVPHVEFGGFLLIIIQLVTPTVNKAASHEHQTTSETAAVAFEVSLSHYAAAISGHRQHQIHEGGY